MSSKEKKQECSDYFLVHKMLSLIESSYLVEYDVFICAIMCLEVSLEGYTRN